MISIVLPFERAQDVAGPERRAAEHVLGRADDAERAHGQAELGDRGEPSITAAPPAMSPFMSCIRSGGLSARPPESNVTALPTRPSDEVVARAGRVVAQDDQLRLVRASTAPTAANAPMPCSSIQSRPCALDREVGVAERLCACSASAGG